MKKEYQYLLYGALGVGACVLGYKQYQKYQAMKAASQGEQPEGSSGGGGGGGGVIETKITTNELTAEQKALIAKGVAWQNKLNKIQSSPIVDTKKTLVAAPVQTAASTSTAFNGMLN